MNPISFSANLKSDTTINCRKGNRFIPQPAYVVELDKNNIRDLQSMDEVSLLWSKENQHFIPYLLTDFTKDIDQIPDVIQNHCFVLTVQDKDFEHINPQKVLGALLFSEEEIENEINWLQVQPKNNRDFNPANRQYKNIGKALVSYLKEKYCGKSIFVNSSNTAIEFYKKQGFKEYSKDCACSLHCDA